MRLTDISRNLQNPLSANGKIFRATAIVGCLSVAVKTVATLKEVAVAGYFGRGDGVDAFLMAFMLPFFMVNLVAATFNTALIPTFIQVRERDGQSAAQELLSSTLLWSQGLLLVVTCCLALVGPHLLRTLASTFTPDKYILTVHLFYLMIPVVVLSGIATNCGAVLNASGRFAVPAIASLSTPAMTLLLLLTRGRAWGVWSLAAGVLVGTVCEAAVVGTALHRLGIRLLPGWSGSTHAVRQVRSQYLPLLAAGAMGMGITLVDQTMAAWLQPGSLAALSYGGRIVSVVVGLAGSSLSTALVPYFSEMVARHEWEGCKHTLRTYRRLMLMAMLPVCAVLIAGSSFIVRVLYQHGAFTKADTIAVSHVQSMYALQIPFFAVSLIYIRLLTALKRNDLVMISSGINLALDIPLNIVCMHFLGVAGIALATSLYYAGSSLFLAAVTRRVMRQMILPLPVTPSIAGEYA